MPGPVSDSYDPEFGTAANAADVASAINDVCSKLTKAIGSEELKFIVDVVHGRGGHRHQLVFTERELRILRFSIGRALETL